MVIENSELVCPHCGGTTITVGTRPNGTHIYHCRDCERPISVKNEPDNFDPKYPDDDQECEEKKKEEEVDEFGISTIHEVGGEA